MKTFVPRLLATALAFASWEAMAGADMVLLNGKVFTADKARPMAQALAVADGKVLAVGSDAEISALADAGTQRIDLGGKALMPGLIDTHAHAIFGGLEMSTANMGDEQVSLDELEKRLRAWRDDGTARRGDALYVGGMTSAYWAQAEALGQRFDRGEWAGVPIVLVGSDHHTAWANAAMRQRAGIDAKLLASLPEAERGTIGLGKDGTPNGFLVDAGWDRVAAVLPLLEAATLLRAGENAVNTFNSLGVTAWMDPAANGAPGEPLFALKPTEKSVGVLPVYKALAEKGELTAHVAALLVAHPKSRPADLDTLDKVRQQFQGIDNLSLPGIKVFADGVLEYPAQSAALIDPYSNSHKQGELLIDPAHFGELVSAADARGWLVHIHAIGDRAVREGAQRHRAGPPRPAERHHPLDHPPATGEPQGVRALQAARRDRLHAAALGRRRRLHAGHGQALRQRLRLPLPVPGALAAAAGGDPRRRQRLAGVLAQPLGRHGPGRDPRGRERRTQCR